MKEKTENAWRIVVEEPRRWFAGAAEPGERRRRARLLLGELLQKAKTKNKVGQLGRISDKKLEG